MMALRFVTMDPSSTVLLTGATGLIGQFLLEYLANYCRVVTPTRHEMDIVNKGETRSVIHQLKPSVIIHAAAFTDNTKAESERGNIQGLCWQTNVEGTRNISEVAESVGAYVIFLSTGSVFAGSIDSPGPFTERDLPSAQEDLSWYGWTKAQAEKKVNGAIIRLSHPVKKADVFDIPQQDTVRQEPRRLDYIQNFVTLFDHDALYPLFTDQHFSLTYLDDVVIAIKQLLEMKQKGIFHIVSYDTVTPFELASYAIYKARHVQPALKSISFQSFINTQPLPKRFTQYCAIDGSITREQLQLPARTWKGIVDCLYPEIGKAD